MKTILTLLFATTMLAGCNQANVQPSTANNTPTETTPAVVSDARLVAMAYNIRYDNEGDGANAWPKRADKVAEMIRSNQVDFGSRKRCSISFIWLNENLAEYDFVESVVRTVKRRANMRPSFGRKIVLPWNPGKPAG